MKTDGLGAGRRSRKPRPVRRFERFGEPMVSETSCFTRFLLNLRVRCRCFGAENKRTLRVVSETDPPQTPSVAVFAEGRAPKSQTALGNRWPGAATSDQEPNTNVKPRFRSIPAVICSRCGHFCNSETLCSRDSSDYRLQKWNVFGARL